MARVSIDIGQAVKLIEQLGRQKAPAALMRGARSFAQRAKPMMVLATNEAPSSNPAGLGRGAVNTGNYRRNWKSVVGRDGRVPYVIVNNLTPYAGVIEYGRRAGARAPRSEVLIPWVQRKLGLPFKEAKGRAYIIARAIKRRGLKPRRVLTSDDQVAKLTRAFREEILRSLIDMTKDGL